jgi:hypothetical protein
MRLGDHPLEFSAWIEERLGAEAKTLRDLAMVTVNWPARLKADLLVDMRRELVRLEAAEAGGGEFFGFELPTVNLVIERGRERAALIGQLAENRKGD